ncbi:MAG: hypothetical protein GY767_02455, partial [Shimia sp.]|nr:hypothetical protein [Shimia sp.]
MPAIQQSVEQLKTLFALRQCWMIEPLAASMGCAVVSVRRLLRQAGYLRSYTHNGKWYTLDSIPAFDRHGIWVHEEIAFSRHGDLIKTIAHLLDKSPRGLSARELSEILHHPCQAVLTHLHKAERVARVRGAQAFVYLSSDASTRQRQRKALPAVERAQRPPPDGRSRGLCAGGLHPSPILVLERTGPWTEEQSRDRGFAGGHRILLCSAWFKKTAGLRKLTFSACCASRWKRSGPRPR